VVPGRKIAFTGGIVPLGSDVYVMNRDGSDLRRLTDSPGFDGGPAWSPDGSKLAFASKRDGGSGIYLMRPDGTDVSRIIDEVAICCPAWSPDGSRIAFVCYGATSELCTANPDGTGLFHLPGSFTPAARPAWSPDSLRIAFVSQEPGTSVFDIFSIKADGSGRTNLTKGVLGPGSCCPSWLP